MLASDKRKSFTQSGKYAYAFNRGRRPFSAESVQQKGVHDEATCKQWLFKKKAYVYARCKSRMILSETNTNMHFNTTGRVNSDKCSKLSAPKPLLR